MDLPDIFGSSRVYLVKSNAVSIAFYRPGYLEPSANMPRLIPAVILTTVGTVQIFNSYETVVRDTVVCVQYHLATFPLRTNQFQVKTDESIGARARLVFKNPHHSG